MRENLSFKDPTAILKIPDKVGWNIIPNWVSKNLVKPKQNMLKRVGHNNKAIR